MLGNMRGGCRVTPARVVPKDGWDSTPQEEGEDDVRSEWQAVQGDELRHGHCDEIEENKHDGQTALAVKTIRKQAYERKIYQTPPRQWRVAREELNNASADKHQHQCPRTVTDALVERRFKNRRTCLGHQDP